MENSKIENIQRPPSSRKLQKWPILGILEIYKGDLPHQNLSKSWKIDKIDLIKHKFYDQEI